MEILYRTNTTHIASVILLRRFQGILSPRIVESITSLELVWNSRLLRFEDGFTGMSGQSMKKPPPSPVPLFPSLQYLRISFIHTPWSQAVHVDDVNHALGLPFNLWSAALLQRMLAQQADLEPGEFVWMGGDVHLYLNHASLVEEQVRRVPAGRPRLRLRRRPDSIFGYRLEDMDVVDYQPQAHIAAPVAV